MRIELRHFENRYAEEILFFGSYRCLADRVYVILSYRDYYKLDEQYLQRQQLETKQFDTNDEEQMLTGAAQVLQDLGFSIDESETRLGIITASKSAEASTFAEKAGSVLLSGMNANYDIEQKNLCYVGYDEKYGSR